MRQRQGKGYLYLESEENALVLFAWAHPEIGPPNGTLLWKFAVLLDLWWTYFEFETGGKVQWSRRSGAALTAHWNNHHFDVDLTALPLSHQKWYNAVTNDPEVVGVRNLASSSNNFDLLRPIVQLHEDQLYGRVSAMHYGSVDAQEEWLSRVVGMDDYEVVKRAFLAIQNKVKMQGLEPPLAAKAQREVAKIQVAKLKMALNATPLLFSVHQTGSTYCAGGAPKVATVEGGHHGASSSSSSKGVQEEGDKKLPSAATEVAAAAAPLLDQVPTEEVVSNESEATPRRARFALNLEGEMTTNDVVLRTSDASSEHAGITTTTAASEGELMLTRSGSRGGGSSRNQENAMALPTTTGRERHRHSASSTRSGHVSEKALSPKRHPISPSIISSPPSDDNNSDPTMVDVVVVQQQSVKCPPRCLENGTEDVSAGVDNLSGIGGAPSSKTTRKSKQESNSGGGHDEEVATRDDIEEEEDTSSTSSNVVTNNLPNTQQQQQQTVGHLVSPSVQSTSTNTHSQSDALDVSTSETVMASGYATTRRAAAHHQIGENKKNMETNATLPPAFQQQQQQFYHIPGVGHIPSTLNHPSYVGTASQLQPVVNRRQMSIQAHHLSEEDHLLPTRASYGPVSGATHIAGFSLPSLPSGTIPSLPLLLQNYPPLPSHYIQSQPFPGLPNTPYPRILPHKSAAIISKTNKKRMLQQATNALNYNNNSAEQPAYPPPKRHTDTPSIPDNAEQQPHPSPAPTTDRSTPTPHQISPQPSSAPNHIPQQQPPQQLQQQPSPDSPPHPAPAHQQQSHPPTATTIQPSSWPFTHFCANYALPSHPTPSDFNTNTTNSFSPMSHIVPRINDDEVKRLLNNQQFVNIARVTGEFFDSLPLDRQRLHLLYCMLQIPSDSEFASFCSMYDRVTRLVNS